MEKRDVGDDRAYGLADIFSWWVHEISESDRSERLRQTKKSLLHITDIGACQFFYGASANPELRQLVMDHCLQLIASQTSPYLLKLTLRNLKKNTKIRRLAIIKLIKLVFKI